MTRNERRRLAALHAVAVAGAVLGLGIAIAEGDVALVGAFVAIGVFAGHLLAIFGGWVDVCPPCSRRHGEVVVNVTADTSEFRREMAELEKRAKALGRMFR